MERCLFYKENSLASPKIIAHRGASAVEPENSLPAFETAGRRGVWAIETDVHRTLDGKLVCFHNKKVDGLTEGEGAIADMTYAELARLHITAGVNVAAHTPEEILGDRAHLAGFWPETTPASARELLGAFSWDKVRKENVVVG